MLWLLKGLGPGGAERLLVSAGRLRDRSHFDVEVAYLLPWKTALVPELEAEGIRVTCLGWTPAADLRWILRLRRLLRSGHFDVVHSHSPLAAVGARLVAGTLARRSRPVTMSTEHNTWSSHKPLTRWANRLTFGRDAAHLAVSEDTRRSLPARLRGRVEVVVHGTDLRRAESARSRREAVRAALGIDAECVAIITVANFRANKSYPDLLAAARRVLDDAPRRCRFLLVGQGPLKAEILEERRRLHLEQDVEVLGHREDVFDLLAASDIFLLASRFEGLPVALMEALAVGLPVVATAVGGIPGAIRSGENGILVPAGESVRLAEALLQLIGDDGRRRAMAVSAARSGRNFDAECAVRTTEARYQRFGHCESARRRGNLPGSVRFSFTRIRRFTGQDRPSEEVRA